MSEHTILVDKADFSTLKNESFTPRDLAPGHIRVTIGPFALTANNITYMVTGDMIGYWNFFAPEAYQLSGENMGRMPVWGYGTVTESNVDGITIGEVIYGFFPVATLIDLKPENLSNLSFADGAAHRTALHPIYNTYTRTENDPSFVPALHEIQPVLRPLFTTSFLIDDQFGDADFYGAEQIILLSASSKTALGTAFCLKERGGVSVVGLTSSGNKNFVKDTGFYHAVEAYDAIAYLNSNLKTAIIDMAGNGKVTSDLYNLYGDNIVYACMVGKSHWQGDAAPKPDKGAPPKMFFAPDRAKMRIADWGGAGFAQKLAERWIPFCQSAQTWLEIENAQGVDAFTPVYEDFLTGRSDPSKGFLFSL